MKFFPYEKFEIDTGMVREEVVSRLRNLTCKRRFFKLRREKPFEGEVSDNGFRIRYAGIAKTNLQALREIMGSKTIGKNGTNEQTLDISGNFEEKQNGTTVSLKLTPILFIKIFLITWVAVIVPAGMLYIFLCLRDSNYYQLFFIIPVALLVIAYLSQWIVFSSAVYRIKSLLTAILKKQE